MTISYWLQKLAEKWRVTLRTLGLWRNPGGSAISRIGALSKQTTSEKNVLITSQSMS